MSVIWSGVTEEGAVVPVQVTDEGKVVAVGDGPQGDYLPITGGNLTGDLTLGTDKIALDATDGSGSFSGNVISSANSASSSGIFPNGAIYAVRDGVGVASVNGISNRGDYLFAGGDTAGSSDQYNVYLFADGSAEFDDNVLIDKYLTVTNSEFSADAKVQIQGDTDVAVSVYPAITGGARTIELRHDGSATFAGVVRAGASSGGMTDIRIPGAYMQDSGGFFTYRSAANSTAAVFQAGVANGTTAPNTNITLNADGTAVFSGDVVIGSRGDKWLIRESNGVAMLVQQSREAAPMIPEAVRDIPSELDLIEMALNEVMEKLRMTPPAGWPVWDGSDNP